jgi:AcrR family transcriptional regulator
MNSIDSLTIMATKSRTSASSSAPTRKERAAATRERILAAAYEAFVESGFQATTMPSIAERAGVAVQTVYFVFHTKAELLRAVSDAAVIGVSDPQPPNLADWYRAAVNAADPEQGLAAFVAGVATILDRMGPLTPVLASAAALEPMIAEHLAHTEQLRVEGYGTFIRHLHRNRLFRPGLSVKVATDVLLTLLGPATYVAFTRDRGWSHNQYLRWITPALLELLIKDPPSS